MNESSPALLGGIINSLSVRVEPWVSNWLTPIWILGLGALLAVIVVLLLCGLGFLLSRIEPLSQLSQNRTKRLIGGAVLAAILVGLASPWLVGMLQARWANPPPDLNKFTDILWTYIPATIAALIVGWSVMILASRRTIEELPLLFQEGPLFWMSVTVCSFALFGVLGTVLVRDPESMLESLRRWPSLGEQRYTFTVPKFEGSKDELPPEHPLELNLRRSEIRRMRFESNESLRISPFESEEKGNTPSWDVSANEELEMRISGDPMSALGDLDRVDQVYARNFGDEDAQLTITAFTAPASPEMLTVPIVAVGIVGLFMILLVLWGLLPKMAAIGFATAKAEMNTPLYMLLTVGGALTLFMFVWLPYNTFGEDIKMLKFASLESIMVIAMFQAVWSASSSLAEEVEGRTALTVLSKPVSRRDFILGKFFGISLMVLVMFAVFGSVSLLSVAYKPIFDVREGGKPPERPNVADPLGLVEPGQYGQISETEVTWQICHAEMASTIPALILVYAEVLVLVAVSVAISTRLSLVANCMICLSIFALGNLTPLLVQSTIVAERFEPVIFMGQLVAAVVPMLEYYDVEAAIARGTVVHLAYVGATFVYTAIYCTIAMLVALVLFEDRDLA